MPIRFAARLCTLALVISLAPLAAAQVAVHEPWVRGTVAGQQSTGAFMKLVAAADTTLVAVRSPVAKIVEIHEMKHEGGMMRMRAIERLPLAAGQTVELAPGGYHVMLMGLAAPVQASATVPITLTFEDRAGKRSTVEVSAPVRALTAGAHKSH